MTVYTEGVLVRWPHGNEGVGVVTELPQGGKQVRVWFDDGSEQVFASDNAPIERFYFQEKDSVITFDGSTGVVTGSKAVGYKFYYTVSLPNNVVQTLSETSLRPAPLADPVQRLQAGKVANPRKFALRSTAARYVFANRYDEFTSLENSRIESKPHQISVAHRVISTYPHRFLLADEVGLGKTIEAGMVLKELRARGVAKRVLVLVPANLQVQWQFELKTKFNESFAIYNGITVKALQQGSDQNVWGIKDSIITSHSFATHTDERMDEIASVDWDVVIVDEAHHARVYQSGSRTTTTRPYRLVRRLADFDEGDRRSLLLLTATPMQLNTTELYYLIDLLDPALFPSVEAFEEQLRVLPELNRLVRAVDNYGDEYRVAHILQEHGSPTLGKRGNVYEMLARRIEGALDGDSPAVGEDGSAGTAGGMAPLNGTLDTAEGRERVAEALRGKHRLSEVLIRNRKRNVGGFKPRQAFNWPVEQTDEERAAYAAVERYVREGYQRALETQNNALGFVMVIFQKLMTSSSRALRTSLRKRRDKLAARTMAHEGSLDLEDLEDLEADEEEAAASRVERASAEDGALVSSEELLHLDSSTCAAC